MLSLSHLRRTWRFFRNPGGATHRSRLSKAEAQRRREDTTERLRREVELNRTLHDIGTLAVSEALFGGEKGRVGP